LILQYFDEQDNPQEERFDMLVLSVGLVPHEDGVTTAGRIGMETDRFGFAQRTDLNPLITSREGRLHLRRFPGPQGYPGHGDAGIRRGGRGGRALAQARGSELKKAEFPPERDITGEEAPHRGVRVPLRHQHRRGGGRAGGGGILPRACPGWRWQMNSCSPAPPTPRKRWPR
jgi:hypothetical protein